DLGPAVFRERDEVHAHVLLEDAYGLLRGHGLEEGPLDLPARHVAGVDDAPRAVATLEVEVELRAREARRREARARLVGVDAGGREVELRAGLSQHGDPRRSVLDRQLD